MLKWNQGDTAADVRRGHIDRSGESSYLPTIPYRASHTKGDKRLSEHVQIFLQKYIFNCVRIRLFKKKSGIGHKFQRSIDGKPRLAEGIAFKITDNKVALTQELTHQQRREFTVERSDSLSESDNLSTADKSEQHNA